MKVLGYNRASAARAAKVGRLKRLHRGVYVVGRENLSWEGRLMAAVLACAPAVASHWSAAWLWGLLQSQPTGAFHLTAPNTRHRRRDFVIHSAVLRGEDVTAVEEHPAIPVTSLERTHLDLAAVAPERLDRFLERCEELHLFDLRRFESLLARTSGHAGHASLAKALEIYRPDPTVTRSNFERRFRALLRDASLPSPSHNVFVGRYELGCYWPASASASCANSGSRSNGSPTGSSSAKRRRCWRRWRRRSTAAPTWLDKLACLDSYMP